MRLTVFIIFLCFFSINLKAELLKPSPSINPEDVISIQLSALQMNNYPYEDAGIAQTWEFAHPFNRQNTGPLEKFTTMMYSPSYVIMLDHEFHKIILVSQDEEQAFYFIELIDKFGNEYGFQWILKKFLGDGNFKNCWMTVGVSTPMYLSKTS